MLQHSYFWVNKEKVGIEWLRTTYDITYYCRGSAYYRARLEDFDYDEMDKAFSVFIANFELLKGK